MSIQNDKWILRMAEEQAMIHPFVREQVGGGIISYGPSSFGYDLRAGHHWKIFTDLKGACIDPKRTDHSHYVDVEALSTGEAILLPPNSYALTHSVEYIRMPPDTTGICLGKSTYARVGIHVNVTPLEAGWEGQVTIEVSNGTRLPVKLYAGEGILQVLFFKGEAPAVTYNDRGGKYQGQKGITLPRILPR